MRPIIIGLLTLALAVVVFLWKRTGARTPEARTSSRMPEVVGRSMDVLLHELDAEIAKNQPGIKNALLPPITQAQLEGAEAELGTPLQPEIRALYAWHNGMDRSLYLFPGYEFYSLEEAIQLRQDANAYYQQKGLQLFMAKEAAWLSLFSDPAGDGYFYDFKKDYARGGVFFVFRESGYYVHFPSLRNLLAGIIDCYRQGAYKGTETVDFGLEVKIMESYGQVESD